MVPGSGEFTAYFLATDSTTFPQDTVQCLVARVEGVVKRSGGYTPKSNFTRVTWNEPELLVQTFERKGEKTAETRFTL